MELKLTIEQVEKIAQHLIKIGGTGAYHARDYFKYKDEKREWDEVLSVSMMLYEVGTIAAELEGVSQYAFGLRAAHVAKIGNIYIVDVGELFAYAIKQFIDGQLPFLPQLDSNKRDKRRTRKALQEQEEEEED